MYVLVTFAWLMREFKSPISTGITLKSYKLVKTFFGEIYCRISPRYRHPGERGKRGGEDAETWPVNGRLAYNMTPVVFEECNNRIMRAVTVV